MRATTASGAGARRTMPTTSSRRTTAAGRTDATTAERGARESRVATRPGRTAGTRARGDVRAGGVGGGGGARVARDVGAWAADTRHEVQGPGGPAPLTCVRGAGARCRRSRTATGATSRGSGRRTGGGAIVTDQAIDP